MKHKWPVGQKATKTKRATGDIVKKSSSGAMFISDAEGISRNQASGLGTTLFCYVVRQAGGECLVRVIRSTDLNPGIASHFADKYAFVETKYLEHGDKEKRLTAAGVYDGENFHPDRMKNANSNKKRTGNKNVER